MSRPLQPPFTLETAIEKVRMADLPIGEGERKYHWPQGPRPADYPGLSELGL